MQIWIWKKNITIIWNTVDTTKNETKVQTKQLEKAKTLEKSIELKTQLNYLIEKIFIK